MCGIRDQHSRCVSRNTHLAVSTNGRRPLLISTSLALIDRVVRLASTAALEVQVAPDAASAMRYWLDAPLVMIGSDVSMGHDLIADLAALAAARSSACSAAQEVARLHHSILAACAFDGTDVEVAVTVSTTSAWTPTVTRRARSGY